MHRTRVKVCCMMSVAETEVAVALGADALGLVGPMPSVPGVIEDETAARLASAVSPLDSGRPSAKLPELGGTGQRDDWDVSAKFVKRSPIPVFLAGGLRPENVEEAVATVKPFGVDLCTGVRSDGHLDPGKLHRFMSSVAKADRSLREQTS
ncbi:MAG: N-(5'-phosphoribosyl)anthranilate isomerase [Myxococcota bacterium]